MLLLATPDPAAFVEAWHARNEANIEALIRKAHKGEYADRLVGYLKAYRQVIFARLRKLKVRYRRFDDVPSFVNEQAQYDRIVALYRSGRVFAVRGDLTGPHTMQAIAAAAKLSGVPMRVLYPSNAEQYFSWKKQYRDNILAFPFDADSVIIRTKACADPKTPKNCYKYYVQKGVNFQKWMHSKQIRGIRRMLFTALPKGKRGLLELRKGPPDA